MGEYSYSYKIYDILMCIYIYIPSINGIECGQLPPIGDDLGMVTQGWSLEDLEELPDWGWNPHENLGQ